MEDFRQKLGVGSCSLDIWHGCLQSLQQYRRGWSLRIVGHQKEIMKDISARIEEFDVLAKKKIVNYV